MADFDDHQGNSPLSRRDPLLVEREKTHGSFRKNAEIWASLKKAAYTSSLNQTQQLALEMLYVKLARLLSGQSQEPDHWNDIAGYAKLGAEACEK